MSVNDKYQVRLTTYSGTITTDIVENNYVSVLCIKIALSSSVEGLLQKKEKSVKTEFYVVN